MTSRTGTMKTWPNTISRREYFNLVVAFLEVSQTYMQYTAATVKMMQCGKTERPE